MFVSVCMCLSVCRVYIFCWHKTGSSNKFTALHMDDRMKREISSVELQKDEFFCCCYYFLSASFRFLLFGCLFVFLGDFCSFVCRALSFSSQRRKRQQNYLIASRCLFSCVQTRRTRETQTYIRSTMSSLNLSWLHFCVLHSPIRCPSYRKRCNRAVHALRNNHKMNARTDATWEYRTRKIIQSIRNTLVSRTY